MRREKGKLGGNSGEVRLPERIGIKDAGQDSDRMWKKTEEQ